MRIESVRCVVRWTRSTSTRWRGIRRRSRGIAPPSRRDQQLECCGQHGCSCWKPSPPRVLVSRLRGAGSHSEGPRSSWPGRAGRALARLAGPALCCCALSRRKAVSKIKGSVFDWGSKSRNLLIEYQSINRIVLRSTMKSPLILPYRYQLVSSFAYVAPDVALCFHEQLTIEIVILRRQYADKHTFNLKYAHALISTA